MRKITWGAARENTLWIPYFENANAWSKPGPDWEWIRAGNGYRDAWEGGWDHMASGDVPWIPKSATTLPVFSSGWDGAQGWGAFLRWAAVWPNWYGFHSEARNLYRYPDLAVDTNADGVCDGHTILRSVVSTAYVMDGGAQRITAAFTAANNLACISASERFPAWPGMPPLAYSVEAKVTLASGATAGSAQLIARRTFHDSAGVVIGAAVSHVLATNPNTVDFVRYTVSEAVGAAPANTASVSLSLGLRSTPGTDASGNGTVAWLRRASAEVGGFTAYYDGDLYTPCYLVLPMGDPPQLENNGSRRIHLEQTSTGGQTFDGFTYG